MDMRITDAGRRMLDERQSLAAINSGELGELCRRAYEREGIDGARRYFVVSTPDGVTERGRSLYAQLLADMQRVRGGGSRGKTWIDPRVCTADSMLIGIAGAKRAGKDTLARELAIMTGLQRDSFAAPLREFVARLLGWTMGELEARKEYPVDWLDGVTPRHMMQTIGTEWGRDTIHGELWVRSLMQRTAARGAIISDVRFPNEAQAIRERGGIVLKVTRPGTGTGDAHISETPLPAGLVDAVIENDSTPAIMAGRAFFAVNCHYGRA